METFPNIGQNYAMKLNNYKKLKNRCFSNNNFLVVSYAHCLPDHHNIPDEYRKKKPGVDQFLKTRIGTTL